MRQTIKAEVLQQIKEDEDFIFEVAKSLNRKFRTVYQWILVNHEMLSSPVVVKMISHRFKLKETEILVDCLPERHVA